MKILDIDRLIYARLAADVPLTAIVSSGIYSLRAPAEATLPYVVFRLITSMNTNGTGGTVALVSARYSVVCSGEGESLVSLETAAERIVAVLSGNFGDIGGVFDAPLAYDEFFDGQAYRHLGGLFDFYASPS